MELVILLLASISSSQMYSQDIDNYCERWHISWILQCSYAIIVLICMKIISLELDFLYIFNLNEHIAFCIAHVITI